eukprot:CAMPEP_0182595798 /NCGR_PEP_ID=MMETSP1324-20130603/82973_1 /TAXON_ID=236786 /ORGANISM="Florenciella sp., Strain RCC1587" /LENGTH=88 /DNA_ID=CAMNT_0024813427 /DNA_START=25 /DNA_END=287 /DNA_ORIENTATION=+
MPVAWSRGTTSSSLQMREYHGGFRLERCAGSERPFDSKVLRRRVEHHLARAGEAHLASDVVDHLREGGLRLVAVGRGLLGFGPGRGCL